MPNAKTRITGIAELATAALLCIGVLVVHIDDQGGITAFTDPDWLGWAYRLIEVGALLTALLLVTGRLRVLSLTAALLVGTGPLIGYLLSRTVGVPQDADDKGNWADPVGTASMILEGVLIVVTLIALARSRRPADSTVRAHAAHA